MVVFLFVLLAALALVYVNLSTLAKGKAGQIIALSVLVLLFVSMAFRDTWAGSVAVAFFAVWLANALLFYIPWTLYRIGYYFTQPHHLSRHFVRRVSRGLLGVTVGVALAIFAYGVPHNDDYKMMDLTVDLPSQYTEGFTAVFFSDIHVDPLFKAEKLQRFIAQMDSIKPDYLLFGGDLADVSMEQLDAWGYDSLFKMLTSKAKVAAVAVNGNHESMQERAGSNPNDWMRKVGFVVLDDSTACIGKACFTGRTDYMVARGRDALRRPLAELIPDSLQLTEIPQDSMAAEATKDSIGDSAAVVAYDTTIVHRPGIEKGHVGRLPDMALSGHLHDGQFFPVTFIINYVWKVAYGKGALGGVFWLVSSGFDCWGPPVRFGSDSEIWIIKFKPHENIMPE